ncbi:MAG: Chemotaxis protein CheA [Syntrophorhabdus sp. PtaB.Bin184]|jgi:two-component system chemotaxis sensor kinase CheA|nr:MAG: Chemotaxis protein CheA [Syntrophorhabdus sp. PtaB.Bin184]
MIDNHAQTFIEEAFELLSDLEAALLELEENPSDTELIGRVFRALHTIKGSGAMFGFDNVAQFTHTIETVFDDVREGKLPVTEELVSLTLKARDLIRLMIEAPSDEASLPQDTQTLIDSFRRIADGGNLQQTPTQNPNTDSQAQEASSSPQQRPECTYRIRFSPSADIFLTGTNPLLLIRELQFLGECNVFADLDHIPALDEIDPERCFVSWDIILTTDRGLDAIKDVFIFLDESSTIDITMIDSEDSSLMVKEETKKIGEILVERHDIKSEELVRTLSEKKKIGEILVDKGLVSQAKVEAALIEQEHLKKVKKTPRREEEAASSIRVPAEKLDTLVNLVGELVTVQARLTQMASMLDNPEMVSIAEEVERLTGDLRDNTLNIRMLPIGTTFGRFKRLVRDLSQELGREVEMTTEGAETELDKTVIERLNDPLVHLIRNSIDHGIEPPDVRESVGKPRAGMLHIAARHSGAYVLIEITDDGAGIDKEVIRRKAIEKGLIGPDTELQDKEIFSLIFAPGFSTSEKITNVSGRGVGMDVVKRTIDNLRGSVEISSEKGEGTTVTLKLPLTLAIIEGLLVEIDRQFFILPLTIVQECVELSRADVDKSHGRDIANIRGEIVPYIRLRESFAIEGKRPDIEQIVITEVERNRIGLVVDNVIGEHQTVIKSLGKVYRNIEGVSGATILGDGTVALIMDVAKLTDSAYVTAGLAMAS